MILAAALVFLAAAQQPPAPPPSLQPAAVVDHIKASIAWRREVNSVEQIPALGNDVLLRESTRASALKALQLAFEFGHVAAAFLDASAPSAGVETAPQAPARNFTQAVARAAARIEALQNQINDIDARLETAKPAARDTLRAQRNTVQAEMNLATQIRDTINTLATFSPAGGPRSLGTQVDELERSVPEAARRPVRAADASTLAPAAAPAAPVAAPVPATAFQPETTGIIGLTTELLTLLHNRGQLVAVMQTTDALTRSLQQTRAPLLEETRGIVRRSEELANISGDEDVKQLASDQRDIQALTARFKRLTAVMIPLGEQNIVLGGVRGNVAQAHESVNAQYSETARYLLLRLGLLALGIAAVMVVSSIWRRITFRYVRDVRRRTHFLTLRRVVVAIAITIVIVLSFVSEFGSLATYAGLLTAGIAVALQNVILSVVAYFFLIGRYGVRAGDRVTISGVTGTVLDIGLVRIYLAELAGPGSELHATGRVVVYSNSVIFQPAALFKQMPEADYVWHTMRLVLTTESDFQLAETRIKESVGAVYQSYRQSIDQQHANFERAVDARIAQPQPDVRLQYSDAGLEVLVHYPARLKEASVADNQIAKALQEAVAGEPKLTLADAGMPRLVATAA
jgi:small-conductance mechanosensitive channel